MVLIPAPRGKRLGRLCCLVILLTANVALAQGVSVAPSRIVLDGKTRAATVFLSNRSNETETYRISLAEYRMSEDGSLVRVDSMQTSPSFAGEVLRYSPRRVVIPPGGSQTVRLLVRRPTDRALDDVEFRAHLSVCSVPTVPRLAEMEAAPLPELRDDQFSVQPVASVETLVPIVVRLGQPRAEMAIKDATIKHGPDGMVVHFTIERHGDRSLYGNLTLSHVDGQGKETQLHFSRGIAVYTPNPRRTFAIAPSVAGVDLRTGRVVVEYREVPEGGGDLQARIEILPPSVSRR